MIKKVISYDKLPSEVLDELHEKYPDGLDDHLFKVSKGNGDYFYAVTCDYEDISYLIKICIGI